MRRRFFVDHFDGQGAFLGGEGAHHLARVLRAEPGQLYELSDGRTVWLARIESVAKDGVGFALVEQLPIWGPRLDLTLLLAIVKFDRFEWALEKATESGVSTIIPLAAARSEKALVLAAPKRGERWEKIILQAAEQSRRLRPPALESLAGSADALQAATANLKILLSARADAQPMKELLTGKQASSAALAIGPEGGWVDAELAAARQAGWLQASMGRLILRTETAVVAALAALNYELSS